MDKLSDGEFLLVLLVVIILGLGVYNGLVDTSIAMDRWETVW